MFRNLKRAFYARRNRLFLEHWTTRTDGDATGEFYVKRKFEPNLSYYDLYWSVKRLADHQRLQTIYVRAEELRVEDVVRDVETKELAEVIKELKRAQKT